MKKARPLSKLVRADIIEPVSGHGKGKYKFKRQLESPKEHTNEKIHQTFESENCLEQKAVYHILCAESAGHLDRYTLCIYEKLRESGDMYSFSGLVSPAIPL